MTEKSLHGRRILVTGAASGIGRATAILFAGQGASLALADRVDRLDYISGAEAIVRNLDASPDADHVVAKAADRLGGLDGLVNCIGADFTGTAEDTDDDRWHAMLTANLSAPFFVIRAAIPYLRRSGGATIVNIASSLGLRPTARRSAYCAAKAGMIMLSKGLAAELGPEIRVNVVAPGATDTPMLRASLPDEADLEKLAALYPLKMLSSAEDIAQSILFLTSGVSRSTTGICLATDSGHSFH